MKEHIRLVVLEHLRNEFDVHIVDVDLLKIFVKQHNRLVEFLLRYS
jgi:hypothetical protein